MVFNLILLLPTAILLLSTFEVVQGYSFYPPINPVLDPDLAIDLKRPRTFNVSGIFGTNTLQTNVAVLNKTVVANSVVAVMLAGIGAYHFLYHLEDGPFSKDSLGLNKDSSDDPGLFDYLGLGGLFGGTSKSDDEKSKKKSKKSRKSDDESCDCESYCSNKYYYGDGNIDPPQDYSTSFYDQKFDQEESSRKKRG
jgi:hypothetical protein